MRKPPLHRWSDLEQTRGLLLVAQRIEEALFDHSLDSYKATALNTHSRCMELVHTITEVRAGRMAEKALAPLYEELAFSIANDSAAEALLGPASQHLRQVSSWSRLLIRDAQAQADYVLTQLSDSRYERELVRQLEGLLLEAKRKGDILRLTNDLIVEWQNQGFSKEYIYYRVRTFFFAPQGKAVTKDIQFRHFADYFRRQPSNYRVVHRASRGFLAVAPKLPTESFEVTAAAPPPISNKGEELAFLSAPHDGVFITVSVDEARDARSASDTAEAMLGLCADVASLHSHRLTLDWSRETLVYSDSGDVRVLHAPKSAIMKQEDIPEARLGEEFARTIEVILRDDLSRDAQDRLRAAMSLHNSAIGARAPETQLFSLWSALESLLPLEAATSRIERICDLLAPVLSRGYPQKLLDDLDASMHRCLPQEYPAVLASLPGAGEGLLRCAQLVVLPEHVDARKRLYASCGDNPLLRYRLCALHDQLANADLVRRAIEAHERRVRWHLRRIYRSRNLVAHRGEALPFRETLVENLHAYLDSTLVALNGVLNWHPRPRNIHAVFVTLELDYRSHTEALIAAKQSPCTEETLSTYLFGPKARIGTKSH